MKKARFSEQQIIEILKLAEAGTKVADLGRKHGISQWTFSDVPRRPSGEQEARPAPIARAIAAGMASQEAPRGLAGGAAGAECGQSPLVDGLHERRARRWPALPLVERRR